MIKRLLFVALLLCARPALAAIACDATAHASHTTLCENISATSAPSATSVSTPAFSTSANDQILVAVTTGDSSSAVFPITMSGASLSWTRRVTHVASAHFTNEFGTEIWTAYKSGGGLTSVTVTMTFVGASGVTSHQTIQVYVLDGVASSEAACIGNAAGYVDDTSGGVSTLVNTATPSSITPLSTGSWLIGAFAQANDTTTLAADSNTSAFDTGAAGASDYVATGRYKSGGTVATTTSGTPVTFGSSTSSPFGYVAALEIRPPGAAPTIIPRGKRSMRGAGI